MAHEIPGMNPAQTQAWLALVSLGQLLPSALDEQLTRDAGLINFEYAILTALQRAKGKTHRAGDLAAALGAPPPRLSKALGRLERRGLIERVSCPTDGRAINVHLTEEGERVWRVASRPHVVLARDVIMGTMSDAELTQLTELLTPLLAQLDPDSEFGSFFSVKDAED